MSEWIGNSSWVLPAYLLWSAICIVLIGRELKRAKKDDAE